MATLKIPHPVPSAVEDAESLRKAFHGWGTDEKAVISILAHRDAVQRKQIMVSYEELYKENLIRRLESEISGHFERAMYRWMFDPIEREVIFANVALKKSVDWIVIIELSCINSPDELLAIKKAYQNRYKLSLEEDVAFHTSGDFRKLLVGLVSTYRYGGEEINASLAQAEAKILHDLFKQRTFDHDEVIRILCTRSKAQLNTTFNCYKDEHGTSITKSLSSASSSEFATALRIAIRCFVSPEKYYEKLLRCALNKGGIDEDSLTRVVVMRAEKDLQVIKDLYQKRANLTLDHAVSKEASGDYKKFLLALIGN
ncbi:putative annexin [Dioscorea sansibarensis]